MKNQCQLFQGCTRNTLYRDQVWHFYRIGRLIERCDQATRLVDVKASRPRVGNAALSAALDISQWHALLRAASAYHGYLRVHREINASAVASYILFDPGFPGSISSSVRSLRNDLGNLARVVPQARLDAIEKHLRPLQRQTRHRGKGIDDSNRHQYLDDVQKELASLHEKIAETFFPAPEA
ncbi:MAG: alpha-E domain-containing protein [Burkholderiaceae bacterium]